MFDILDEKWAWVKKIYVHHDCHGVRKVEKGVACFLKITFVVGLTLSGWNQCLKLKSCSQYIQIEGHPNKTLALFSS